MLLETETGKTLSLPLNKKDVDKMGFKEENVGVAMQSSLEGIKQLCGHQDQVGWRWRE